MVHVDQVEDKTMTTEANNTDFTHCSYIVCMYVLY